MVMAVSSWMVRGDGPNDVTTKSQASGQVGLSSAASCAGRCRSSIRRAAAGCRECEGGPERRTSVLAMGSVVALESELTEVSYQR
jgi:hypothetical protein